MFDGIAVAALKSEFDAALLGGRIAKIAQTEQDELLISIRVPAEKGGGVRKLYLSANPSLPLCYLTEKTKASPQTAPAFCMLLRKYLQNGLLSEISQTGMDRILSFTVSHLDEMGDVRNDRLIIELMGKYSNIMLVDEGDRIIDSIRHVSSMISSVREVLPGRPYFVPPDTKKDPASISFPEFTSLFEGIDRTPEKILSGSLTGISIQTAQEICFRAGLLQDRNAAALSVPERERLYASLGELMDRVRRSEFEPLIYDGPSPLFSAVPCKMLSDLPQRRFDSMSRLLETYYDERNRTARIRQKSSDLRKVVQTLLERESHKLDLQLKQLKDTEKRDKYRRYGELLNAYGYGIAPGSKKAEVVDYYTNEPVVIPLDETMTPQQNAARYFDRYTKLKRTKETLEVLTKEVRAEVEQLSAIRVALDLAETEGDLKQIRDELSESGFLKKHRTDKAPAKSRETAGKPLHFRTSDGYDLYVGKNNLQNDQLTFHFAMPDDLWFHVNDIPGSHVILRTNGQKMEDLPDRAFEEAAAAAAHYSAAGSDSKAEVDYLLRREVKKPSGARPGFVVYYTNYSILVKPGIGSLTPAE